MGDGDWLEAIFILLIDPWVLLFLTVVLVALSVTGVIPWGDWL